MGVNQNISGLETKWLGYGHLVSRSLHAGFWAGERVMGKLWSIHPRSLHADFQISDPVNAFQILSRFQT